MAPNRGFEFGEYVPVAERRKTAERRAAELTRQGKRISPVAVEGKKIANTVWGQAWCDNLERYSDYVTRLPRGRSYLKHGALLHLELSAGAVSALVSGSAIYEVNVRVDALPKRRWSSLTKQCAGQISSVLELLSGDLSAAVMAVLTQRGAGMFPAPAEVHFACTCPDSAVLCKHIAATLYGVGARLDIQPELLFVLRQVDHADLIAAAGSGRELRRRSRSARVLDDASLADVFGFAIAGEESELPASGRRQRSKTKRAGGEDEEGAKSETPAKSARAGARKKPATKGPAGKIVRNKH